MDIKIAIILILIIIFLILCFLYIKKKWVFKNENVIRFKATKENDCTTDLKRCTCPIQVETKDGIIEKKNVTSFDMEKDYYKVTQDLMPYWSGWGQCNAYGLKNRKRIFGNLNDFDVFDGVGNILHNKFTTQDNTQYYKVDSCDLIPCENYGLDDDDKNICRIRSEGRDGNSLDDDLRSNIKRCDPIMTFQTNTQISNACSDESQLPLNQVDTNVNFSHYNRNIVDTAASSNFKYGYFRYDQDASGDSRINPVLIGDFEI